MRTIGSWTESISEVAHTCGKDWQADVLNLRRRRNDDPGSPITGSKV